MDDLYLGSIYEDVDVDGVKKRLRQGFTTGTCAAAATQGALWLLAGQPLPSDLTVTLPIGKRAHLPVYSASVQGEHALCTIQKDGGDDPDVTHGALITVTVQGTALPGIVLEGGEGVGRVTKPGLGLRLGAPAINRIPQKMILHEAQQMLETVFDTSWFSSYAGLKISVAVEHGEDIAQNTCNPRLGIVGGISILGTTGLVRPYSLSSWKASVVLATKVACENHDQVVLVPGSRSKQWADQYFTSFPPESVVEIGRFLGHALHVINIRPTVTRVIFAAMPGKLTKVAQGAMDLHAYESSVDLTWLLNLARDSGVKSSVMEDMQHLTTAGGIVNRARHYPRFLKQLTLSARNQILTKLRDGVVVDVYLLDAQGHILSSSVS
ncbi:cobalt-precorrin 5B C1-methyltransferase [Sulfobacillus thermosulfidooxidans DSM 9293]|uniref:Cobalt-precorrin-5B C(1)-methyltransferase n=1 Tax=Sulfobacillus thermosulfidooxidans (strain DSM 9293 / VKM B-1269 / AT-1) TaxID=929705 RepID=A0A1W1WH03_SULTA|nr:cobalt-precorrin-5B (C(1))-methyltransferase [Sulfobacillus thermosulfidooxidans]SMC05581.1 cobalt-precorrin 5B C1-methyltransferase [Sulfobacillus thermosulfidooxidans DSM 9293]